MGERLVDIESSNESSAYLLPLGFYQFSIFQVGGLRIVHGCYVLSTAVQQVQVRFVLLYHVFSVFSPYIDD